MDDDDGDNKNVMELKRDVHESLDVGMKRKHINFNRQNIFFQISLKHLGYINSANLRFYALCVRRSHGLNLGMNEPVFGGFLLTFIQSNVLEVSSTWSKSLSLLWGGNLV